MNRATVHAVFLFLCFQSCQSIFDRPEPEVSSDVSIHLHTSFDFVTKAISHLRDKIENMTKVIAELAEERKKIPFIIMMYIHVL